MTGATYRDIMFSPQGSVTGPPATAGVVHFLLNDLADITRGLAPWDPMNESDTRSRPESLPRCSNAGPPQAGRPPQGAQRERGALPGHPRAGGAVPDHQCAAGTRPPPADRSQS